MKADGGVNERKGIHGKVIYIYIYKIKKKKDQASSSQRFRLPLLSQVYDPAGRKSKPQL